MAIVSTLFAGSFAGGALSIDLCTANAPGPAIGTSENGLNRLSGLPIVKANINEGKRYEENCRHRTGFGACDNAHIAYALKVI